MLSLLPAALLVLFFSSPVFSEPTSPNDPFRALALRVPKHPENPICCLKPLTPLEPVDDEILLSFEDWKMKQLAVQDTTSKPKEKNATQRSTGGDGGVVGSDASNTGETPNISPDDSSGSSSHAQGPSEQWTGVSPHFRVPLTDRFNYASLDCSARVHTSHRSAKSPSSILSSKRDRYMLSPCDTKEKQFVVVELCDDIRIDTVQLANFEFFSGVFKDFTVSVAKTYTTDLDGWTLAGTYRAKNVRGVQSFHPPTSLRDFYRYIRIDFQSHYGNEYYCPVSLLRVYGLTHLEQWKWDIWEAESRAKLEKGRQNSLPVDVASEPQSVPNVRATNTDANDKQAPDGSTTSHSPDKNNTVGHHTKNRTASSATPISEEPLTVSKIAPTVFVPTSSETPLSAPSTTQKSKASSNFNDDSRTHSTDTYVSPSTSNSPTPSSSRHESSDTPVPSSEPAASKSSPYTNTTALSLNASHSPSSVASPSIPATPTIIVSSPSVAVIPIIPPPLPPAPNSGESIYRTIMNRLTAVETNHTLYMRYIDQQNSAVRDVIKRLGEDVGRLEGMSRAQTLMYQRTFSDWEKHRYQLQMEYGDLVTRIEYLSEEIILEKRLGVAQLCLLLAVLVFLGLTRGSRPENLTDRGPARFNRSVREWGKRHFSLTGDWTGPFKTKNPNESRSSHNRSSSASRARTPGAVRPRPVATKSYPPQLHLHLQDDGEKVEFPLSGRPRSKEPLETLRLNTAPVSSDYLNRPRTISNPRSGAPSLRSTPVGRRAQYALQHRPITPTRTTLRAAILQRSNSHDVASFPQSTSWGGPMNVPKSAKKWARTAHLHEVKVVGPLASTAHRSNKAMDLNAMRHDRDQSWTPREFEFGIEHEDIFSSPLAQRPLAAVGGHGISTKEKDTISDSLLFRREVSIEDGDPWVDTDSVDGSELDAEQILDISSSRVVSPAKPS